VEDKGLPLPPARCLSKEHAADYLGIGVTLLTELEVPFVKLGRRCVYDVLDLDAWLNDYKQRGRAGKDKTLWLKKQESTEGQILGTGGLMQPSQTVSAYAEALRPRTDSKPKRISPS
jgi:hypothetical protein